MCVCCVYDYVYHSLLERIFRLGRLVVIPLGANAPSRTNNIIERELANSLFYFATDTVDSEVPQETLSNPK